MTDDATTPGATAAANPTIDEIATDTPVAPRCPWCSELLPEEPLERCPACRANLVAERETRLPGLTEVETPTATRVRRAEAPKRSKLLSWISGEIDDADLRPLRESGAEALAPPPRDVRREMLRLKLEAEGLTVAADGSIEIPTAPAPSEATAAEPTANGEVAPGAEPGPAPTYDTQIPPEDIRKAS